MGYWHDFFKKIKKIFKIRPKGLYIDLPLVSENISNEEIVQAFLKTGAIGFIHGLHYYTYIDGFGWLPTEIFFQLTGITPQKLTEITNLNNKKTLTKKITESYKQISFFETKEIKELATFLDKKIYVFSQQFKANKLELAYTVNTDKTHTLSPWFKIEATKIINNGLLKIIGGLKI